MKGLHGDFWVNIANADAGPFRNVKSHYGAATYDPETGAREFFVHSYLGFRAFLLYDTNSKPRRPNDVIGAGDV